MTMMPAGAGARIDPAGDLAGRPYAVDPGFGVYIHWPFCAQKCPYCDFNSHVRFGGAGGASGWDEAAFLNAYRRELAWFREQSGPQRVASVFFGGGTPSLMQGATVGALILEIARLWDLAPDAEITLEANPGSVEADRFRDYRAAGVNRVSIGVQALNEADLKALGRIHSVAEARRALDVARSTFERVSFDLIYARPGQSVVAWEAELRQALSFAPGHLSLYQLTIEPGTVFEKRYAAGKLHVPDADLAGDMFALTRAVTAEAGLPAYEVSNHARPGHESRHNLIYWRYGSYVGVGPGAHGRIVAGGGRMATETERHPETWLANVQSGGHGLTIREPIEAAAAADEMLLMGLRLTEGVDLGRLAAVGGVRPADETVAQLAAAGLVALSPDGGHLRAVGDGQFLINRLALELSAAFQPVPAVTVASARPATGAA